MKYKKLLSFLITFSLMAISYPTGIVYAKDNTGNEAIKINKDTEPMTDEEISDTEKAYDESKDAKEQDNPEDIGESEELENPESSDALYESEDLEESTEPEESDEQEELLEKEESQSLTSVIISTKKNITVCTDDNELVESETEICRCELSSEDGMSLNQIPGYAFSDSDQSSLIKMEENAFKELSLPDDISELKITFLVNENEDKIISIKCDY
ncbi:hypothetical protein CIY_25410 [Butyrivibrio fibrisolvens 16/4]|nr:hypothetical protein CIY_25410 [Butyrivibrio fibrisolvens 16/4]